MGHLRPTGFGRKLGVSEAQAIDFLQLVDHDTIREAKDEALAEILVEQMLRW